MFFIWIAITSWLGMAVGIVLVGFAVAGEDPSIGNVGVLTVLASSLLPSLWGMMSAKVASLSVGKVVFYVVSLLPLMVLSVMLSIDFGVVVIVCTSFSVIVMLTRRLMKNRQR